MRSHPLQFRALRLFRALALILVLVPVPVPVALRSR